MLSLLTILLFSLSKAEIFFQERFDEGFEDRWVYSEDKSVTHGVFSRVQKQHCPEGDFAIKSMNDSSYYHASAKFNKPVDTAVSPVYVQFVTQYEQSIDCGGAYIKLFSDLDQKSLTGSSPYSIMLGPDVCGYGTRDIHVILSHKGTNYPLKKKESFSLDAHPHLIELYLGTDKKFTLKVDGVVKREGILDDNFDYLPPKEIDDPEDKKPEDWVDEATIVDENDKKPEDWDDRKNIVDPDAKKPEDWDDSTDGEWEADTIPNPAYKGDWSPKQIPNPNYKGQWKAKQIANPAYQPDSSFANYKLEYVGFDLWTVKSGTIFDEIFVTDSKDEAEEHATVVLKLIKEQAAKIDEQKKAEKPEVETPVDEEGPSDGPEVEETPLEDAPDMDDIKDHEDL